ncbi:hypothetical protein PybrP1_010976 [[Pythium] brassicae (nom. inval.)]|nr:hypothetical protein PybrP1_010976 [[Pythium] brassicae (nom. inval.)]
MSPGTVELLVATAPVVKQHGTAITSTMYKTMFSTHPEVRNLFNMSHHRVKTEEGEATSQQARTLANAVFAFAANADRLGNLTDAVARMVHKHVSLDIRAEHYPIVGSCLLGAIKTVLKDAATPEIMAAWTEGYWFLADLLIAAEDGARAELEALPGGWSGFRELRVARKVRESAEITSFYLASTDAAVPLLPFLPGQYLCLRFDTLSENVLRRNYSLSSAPSTSEYRISVKKESRGDDTPRGIVSCHLHDNIQEGDTVLVAPPCGEFVLKESAKPLVFLAAGVGVTPVLSMLEAAVAAGLKQRVVFVQYARNADVLAFSEHLAQLQQTHPELLTTHAALKSDGESFNLAALERLLPSKDCEFYFCGPPGFLSTVNKALASEWATPAAQRHFEYFGPTQDIDA